MLFTMSAASFAMAIGALLMAHGVMANGTPTPSNPLCGGLEVVDMEMLGITTFDASTFTPQNPAAGLCILGTSGADTIFGTDFDDVILGFKGRGRPVRGVIGWCSHFTCFRLIEAMSRI